MTTTDPRHYGQRCREARENAGLSLATTRDLLRDSIPHRYVPSVKSLQRIEKGEVPEEKVDGMLIFGLARIFRCRISHLSPLVAEEFEGVSDLVASSSPWITTPGQLSLLEPAAA